MKHRNRLQTPNSHRNSSMTSNIGIWSSTLASRSCCTPETSHCCTASVSLHPDGWVLSALVLAGAPMHICWTVSLLGWRASTVSQFKPYNLPDVSTPSYLPGRVSTPTRPDEPSTEDDASEEFEVDFIRAQRGHGSRRQYLIRWKNFGPEDDSWIPEDHLQHAPRVLQWWKE